MHYSYNVLSNEKKTFYHLLLCLCEFCEFSNYAIEVLEQPIYSV